VTGAAGVRDGRIFRAVARTGKVWGKGISQNVVWYVVRACCERVGLEHIAPHDLRRTCAKLCHDSGGELEQIQFLLGHASVQTTERYLGCKQNLGSPVNDHFKLRTEVLQRQGSFLEEVLLGDESFRQMCLAGQRNCPPEDCGGSTGFSELLKALQDSTHPEHDDIREWVGDFVPEFFSADEINRRLRRRKH